MILSCGSIRSDQEESELRHAADSAQRRAEGSMEAMREAQLDVQAMTARAAEAVAAEASAEFADEKMELSDRRESLISLSLDVLR